jgi:hypothetical protein
VHTVGLTDPQLPGRVRRAACKDGMLVPLHGEKKGRRVPLVIRPSNIEGELAKGHRGALGQVASSLDTLARRHAAE